MALAARALQPHLSSTPERILSGFLTILRVTTPSRRTALASLALLLPLLSGCGETAGTTGTAAGPATPSSPSVAGPAAPGATRPTTPLPPVEVETGVVHVHGLGVDPADGVLYAATHSGLFRVPTSGRATRVANRAQDTMGFAVAGPGTFLGSGHPDPREDDVRPPLLGLIRSTDAGLTWERLSLHGAADFHSLVSAHGQVYGYDSTSGTFMVTSDLRTWDRRARLPLRDLAVDPDARDRVVATGRQGLLRSEDGGRTFTPVSDAPALVVLAWDDTAGLYGVDVEGTVHRSTDAARTWTATGTAGGTPEAVAVDSRGGTTTVYVAIAERGILASTDGGATFTTRYRDSGA